MNIAKTPAELIVNDCKICNEISRKGGREREGEGWRGENERK